MPRRVAYAGFRVHPADRTHRVRAIISAFGSDGDQVVCMRYVLFYELAEGAGGLAQEHFPAHRARLDTFHERGDLLLVGTFTDLPMGAMAVFSSREAAEEFMADDPFLLHGVVGERRLREWDEILAP